MRLLLVEDDVMIGEAATQALRDAAWAVDWVRDLRNATLALGGSEYDAILLDLGLTDGDGSTLLQQLRAKNNRIPIIIVTARDLASDRIRGLDLGADDYVIKPFDMDELMARLRAVIRRKDGNASPILSNGIVSLDPATHEAWTANTERMLLPAREFALLEILLLKPGKIHSREALETGIYGWGEEIESNMIDYLVHAIRKKLGSSIIRNVRGAGWYVNVSVPNAG